MFFKNGEPNTILEIDKRFNVPRRTLNDHINSRRNNGVLTIGSGRPRMFSTDTEKYLIDGIILAEEQGWPLNRNVIKDVKSYAIKRNLTSPQNSVFPSRDWIFNFKTRWNHKI